MVFRRISDFDNSNAGQRAYTNIVIAMESAFFLATGSEIPEYPELSLLERFEKALGRYIDEIRENKSKSLELENALREASSMQPILAEMIDDGLLSEDNISSTDREIRVPIDIDDVSPNIFKTACREEALALSENEEFEMPPNEFLRGVVNRVGNAMRWKTRMNVGANRHFPRMVWWVRELETETEWEDGVGFWLLNQSGSGRVREYPIDPSTLKIRIDPAYL